MKNEKKKLNQNQNFFVLSSRNCQIKKKRMLSKIKYYIRKEHVPIRRGMDFSGDLSIFSRKIITTMCDKIKGILV